MPDTTVSECEPIIETLESGNNSSAETLDLDVKPCIETVTTLTNEHQIGTLAKIKEHRSKETQTTQYSEQLDPEKYTKVVAERDAYKQKVIELQERLDEMKYTRDLQAKYIKLLEK